MLPPGGGSGGNTSGKWKMYIEGLLDGAAASAALRHERTDMHFSKKRRPILRIKSQQYSKVIEPFSIPPAE
jgi:hypothetical protein